MQTINANDNGNTFVQKLNDNFAECMTGVNNGNLSLRMFGGQFKTSDGLPEWTSGLASTDAFLKYYHSRPIKVGSNTEIASATLSAGETLTILGYNASFGFVGYSNTLSIPSGSVYIRLMLYKSAGYTTTRTLACSFDSPVEEIKDCHVKETMYKFFYEAPISTDNAEPTSNLSNYTGVNGERHYDCGWLYLPTNYDPQGDPVPLIIYCHGTSGFNWGTPQERFDEFHRFCAYNGYAVADCCGVTDKYVIGSDRDTAFNIVNPYGSGNHNERGMCNPQLMQCINALYEYLAEKYNIRTDGVYLIGRSTGGKTAFLLPYMASFKVKAVAGLAPAIGLVTSMQVFYADENNYVLHRFGLKSRTIMNTSPYTVMSAEDKQYIVDNTARFIGWDAWFVGTDIDMENYLSIAFGNASDRSEQIAAIINGTAKHNPFPSKIWNSADDTAVSLTSVQRYKKMVDNGNGVCLLRVLPDNAGQHFSMDDSPDAPRCNYDTKYKGTKSITVGYAEMIDWFNQW